MDDKRCSICGNEAAVHSSFRHKECGHLTHAACVNMKTHNYKTCNACLNQEPQMMDAPVGEPRPEDGIDYVLSPGERAAAPSMAWNAVTSLLSKRQNSPQPLSSIQLLEKRKPVDAILKQHKMGLHHILKDGGNITDFLCNGYTWTDLLKFEDIGQKGPERALQAIQALGTSANHFRMYPDQFPWASVRDHLKLDTESLGETFGLHFQEGGPLQCEGGDEHAWNAFDLIKLGVNMDNLISFGMTHIEQYEDLMTGLTKQRAQEAENRLGTTLDHVNRLETFAVEEEEKKEQSPTPVPQPKLTLKPIDPPAPIATTATRKIPAYMQQFHERKARHGFIP